MSVSETIDKFISEHSSNTGDPLRDTRDALNVALVKLEMCELQLKRKNIEANAEYDERGLSEADYYTGITREG